MMNKTANSINYLAILVCSAWTCEANSSNSNETCSITRTGFLVILISYVPLCIFLIFKCCLWIKTTKRPDDVRSVQLPGSSGQRLTGRTTVDMNMHRSRNAVNPVSNRQGNADMQDEDPPPSYISVGGTNL
ncbi:unnamed protein product [Allacma fusca]|uniref:Uncharacterized protein n=1 Tax=Allacma fusca TaxID=39272 RepID=A0A8J2KU32_9HEXA|nr:unnamed protein product [Allacma fusca]